MFKKYNKLEAENPLSSSRGIYLNWGKTKKRFDIDGNPHLDYHLLVYHSLDVAAIVQVYLEKDPFLLRQFTNFTKIDKQSTISMIKFLASIHDIGKISENFQASQKWLFYHLRGYISNKETFMKHDELGYSLWQDIWEHIWSENLLNFDTDTDCDDWKDYMKPLLSAALNHHGYPSTKTDVRKSSESNSDKNMDHISEIDESMMKEFVEMMGKFLLNDQSQLQEYDETIDTEDGFAVMSWLLSGLITTADWLASNSRFFTFESEQMSLDKYWKKYALTNAEAALKESGAIPARLSSNIGMSYLFPEITNNFEMTPMQKFASTCHVSDKQQLFIIEDTTGSGKTEAAMVLAQRLMNKNLGNGLYMAMPTMATSNSIYKRLKDAYHRLYDDYEKPSIVLAHSHRHLSDEFLDTIGSKDNNNNTTNTRASSDAHCSEWIADSKKKALLADIGIGTIDQALPSILPTRHQSMKLFGIAQKILVVDEVHSYDPYMHSLLCKQLEFHAAFGGSAILLTATLSNEQKKDLIKAYNKGQNIHKKVELKRDDYPLVTHLTADNLNEYPVDVCGRTQRTVFTEIFESESKAEDKLEKVAQSGGCACYIRNAVDNAIKTFIREKQRNKNNNIKVILFHARLTMGDRIDKENYIVNKFGKDSTYGDREGLIIIATQVVEQSLDIDFDYMVTDLAPMDLIIQRIGRLQRHIRNLRGYNEKPTIGIVTPKLQKDPGNEWYEDMFPRASYVYKHHGQLWLTAQILKNYTKIRIPDDIRDLIEGVFSRNAQSKIPTALLDKEKEMENEELIDNHLAGQRSLELYNGFTPTPDDWFRDVETPTRKGDDTTIVRIAKWNNNKLEPWYQQNTKHQWDMSQITVPTNKIMSIPADEILSKQIKETESMMKDENKGKELLPVTHSGNDVWYGIVINGNNKAIHVSYDSQTGLNFLKKVE